MGIKIWQRRYFVLGRASLRYFVKPDAEARRVYEIDTIVEALAGSKPTELQLQVIQFALIKDRIPDNPLGTFNCMINN